MSKNYAAVSVTAEGEPLFRVSSVTAARMEAYRSRYCVTEETKNLSVKKNKQTVLATSDPMEYCNDFRGLLLADSKTAL